MMIFKRGIFFLLIFLFLFTFVSSHLFSSSLEASKESIEFSNPFNYIAFSFLWLLAFSTYLLLKRKKFVSGENEEVVENKSKKYLFIILITPILLSTFYISGYTIYENTLSETGGPVHWHADYQVWTCGERLDLIDPKGFSNKIGSPLIHEHDDNRIHIEGTLKEIKEANLENYFRIIGGELENGHLIYPTDDGLIDYENGALCDNGLAGNLKVYVNGKLVDNYSNYVLYPDSYVPPADCIIIEFSEGSSQTTDKLCESWEVNGWRYDNFERGEVKIGGYSWK